MAVHFKDLGIDLPGSGHFTFSYSVTPLLFPTSSLFWQLDSFHVNSQAKLFGMK
jgi:hypothetical protein